MFDIDNLRSHDRLQLARAEAFLLEHPDPGVRPRPQDQLERAIDTGLGVQVSIGDRICGLSLVYKYDVEPDGPLFAEIGTMRVTANGYGLQSFLAKFHLVQIALEEFFDGPGDIFAVVTPGTASEHNLRANVGMVMWEPPEVLSFLRQKEGVPFSSDKMVLMANLDAVRDAFRSLSAWHEQGNIFHTPKQAELIHVRSKWFIPDVLNQSP